MNYIAHPAKDGISHQSVKTHSIEVGVLAAGYVSKIGQSEIGFLLGLLHDFVVNAGEMQTNAQMAIADVSLDERCYGVLRDYR